MYYVTKLIQATGLTVIFIGFFQTFPELINMKLFGAGALIFTFG